MTCHTAKHMADNLCPHTQARVNQSHVADTSLLADSICRSGMLLVRPRAASVQGLLTSRRVAVVATKPKATVLTSHLMELMTSRIAIVAYGDPPADLPLQLTLQKHQSTNQSMDK